MSEWRNFDVVVVVTKVRYARYRVCICERAVNMNRQLGSDAHAWAFSVEGKMHHAGNQHPNTMPSMKAGQSISVILGMNAGKIIFDCWDFSGAKKNSVVHAYEGLDGKELYPIISFSETEQAVVCTTWKEGGGGVILFVHFMQKHLTF